MYTKQQIEDTWHQTLEAQKLTYSKMRVSCPAARDTQGALNNAITFIGTDMLDDMMPKMKDVFMSLLDLPKAEAQAKNDRLHKTLTRLGVKQ